MGRPHRDEKVLELKKGPWTREEDQKLLSYIQEHGHGSWRTLPAKAGLERCGKSCRLRWTNYLRPDIKRGKFSSHEEKTIIRLHALLGNRWSAIAAYLPKRTDNEIKNYWNTRLKKRLTRMGIDPATHKPKNNPAATALSHKAQWEAARLEAEARLAGDSNVRLLGKPTARPPLPTPQLAILPCLDVLKVWQANTAAAADINPVTSPAAADSCSNSTSVLMPSFKHHSTVSAVSSVQPNPVVTVDDCRVTEVGKTDSTGNSLQVHHGDDCLAGAENSNGCHTMDIPFDLSYANPNLSECYNIVEGLEDSRNYWNELLNLVSSPLESPWMF